MYKLYEKGSKTTENLRGTREIEDGENPFLDGPCFLCWAARYVDIKTFQKDIFGTVKIGMKMARLRTREELASGYDVKDFPVKFLGVKNNSDGSEPIKDFFSKYFLPLISKDGNKLSLEDAMKNMRNVNIMCHCAATSQVIQLEENIINSMKELGYSDNEISSIQSQMCVFPFETGVKLGDFKSTTISFVDINDKEVPFKVGERGEDIKRLARESVISDTMRRLSNNEAIYALDGTGEHRLGKYIEEGKVMPVCISRIVSNALENSIVNSRRKEFTPIDIPGLVKGVKEIRIAAARGYSQEQLMDLLDSKLNYTGATRIDDTQAKALSDMDKESDRLLAEKKRQERCNKQLPENNSSKLQSEEPKGLAEEELPISTGISESLGKISRRENATGINESTNELLQKVREVDNPNPTKIKYAEK